MILPEENPKIFELFTYWLYTRQAPVDSRNIRLTDQDRLAVTALADRLLVPALQCSMKSSIIYGHRWKATFPDDALIRDIYTTELSVPILRHFIADLCAYVFRNEKILWGKVLLLYRTMPQFGVDMLEKLSAPTAKTVYREHPSTWASYTEEELKKLFGMSTLPDIMQDHPGQSSKKSKRKRPRIEDLDYSE